MRERSAWTIALIAATLAVVSADHDALKGQESAPARPPAPAKREWQEGARDVVAKQGAAAGAAAYRELLAKPMTPSDRALAQVELAGQLQAQAPKGMPDEMRREIEGLYREALGTGSALGGELGLRAHNDWGVLLLRSGDAPGAVRVFERGLDLLAGPGAEPAAAARYRYNLARALEKSGRADDGFAALLEALRLDPGSDAIAAAAAARTQPPATGWSRRTAAAVRALVAAGRLDLAATALRSALAVLGTAPADDQPAILSSLAAYFVAAQVGREEFAKWQAPLVARYGAGERARQMLAELRAAYQRTLPAALEPGRAAVMFPGWAAADRAGFSKLLETIGNDARDRGDSNDLNDLKMARDRFALAWSLDTDNVPACLALAELLLDRGKAIDPDGQMLDELVRWTFTEKGQRYLRGDWPNILRFHTLLATIFERQERWGSGLDPEPMSALYQWQHALSARERLPAAAESPALPGLYARVGNAYERARVPDAAWKNYVRAADSYLQVNQPEAAEHLVGKAEQVGYRPSAADAEKLNTLKATVVLRRDAYRRDAGLRPDESLQYAVQQKLAADPALSAATVSAVSVNAAAGTVVVSGELKNAAEASKIRKVIAKTAGVKNVVIEAAEPPP